MPSEPGHSAEYERRYPPTKASLTLVRQILSTCAAKEHCPADLREYYLLEIQRLNREIAQFDGSTSNEGGGSVEA